MQFFGKSVRTNKMTPIRTILIAVLILPILSFHTHLNAQSPDTNVPTAKSLLTQAAELLKQHHSIQSDITYQADLLGQQINGKGSYSELRTKQIPYMRMELKIPLEDKMGVLVKVCNGRYLWTYRKVLEHEKLEQVDMDRVQEAKEKKAGVSPTNRPGDFDPSLTAVGVGGLPTIVRELNENFDFSTPTEAKLDQMPILRLEGTWNQANLLRLLPKQKKDIEQGQAPNLSELPPHIPDRVAVSLGAHDLFPYRIEYFRNNDRAGQGRGALMTVYFYNIRFDQKISEAYFDYRPGELEPVDKTHEYIEKLK